MTKLNPKYKAVISKRYGVGGNRFAAVTIIEKSSGKIVARCDVKTRSGIKGSDETRSNLIKDAAISAIRAGKFSIDISN